MTRPDPDATARPAPDGAGAGVLRGDLLLPVAVAHRSAILHNASWMRRFLGLHDAAIAPHAKTSMSPALCRVALDEGAWGITVGTIRQLDVLRPRLRTRYLVANEVVGRQELAHLAAHMRADPELELYGFVDSVAGARMLAAAARFHGLDRPIGVLIDGGFAGGRTGCRDVPSALAVGRAVADSEGALVLRGVGGFEGLFAPDGEDAADAVQRFLLALLAMAGALDEAELFGPGPAILSAGGSAYFDLVARTFSGARLRRPTRTIVRSGSYLLHDSGMYAANFERIRARTPEVDALGPGLRHALEICAYVQSVPEPGTAILAFGRRDFAPENGFPSPLWWSRPGPAAVRRRLGRGYAVTAMNHLHAYLRVPSGSPLRVGDIVGCGVSNPANAMDRWKTVLVVDGDYEVVDRLETFF